MMVFHTANVQRRDRWNHDARCSGISPCAEAGLGLRNPAVEKSAVVASQEAFVVLVSQAPSYLLLAL